MQKRNKAQPEERDSVLEEEVKNRSIDNENDWNGKESSTCGFDNKLREIRNLLKLSHFSDARKIIEGLLSSDDTFHSANIDQHSRFILTYVKVLSKLHDHSSLWKVYKNDIEGKLTSA